MKISNDSKLLFGVTAVVALLFFAPRARAIEVILESVIGEGRSGAFELSLDVDAVFDFDVDENALTSTGVWVGELYFGPSRLIRFAHKVEDFGIDSDGAISWKSYECVEGTFGNTIYANTCGNYRYGPNLTDDGGLLDDSFAGVPKSMSEFVTSGVNWDGEKLTIILSEENISQAEVFPEYSLTLTFSVPPPGEE